MKLSILFSRKLLFDNLSFFSIPYSYHLDMLNQKFAFLQIMNAHGIT